MVDDDVGAGGRLVGRHPWVGLGERAGLPVAVETPRPDGGPGQILVAVADVRQLPVQHGPQTRGVDQQVAEPEVAVHDHVGPRIRPVLLEPPVGPFQRRSGLPDGVEPIPVEGQAVLPFQAQFRGDREAVDPGQGPGAIAHQPGPPNGQIRVPEELRRQRFAVQPAGDQVRQVLHVARRNHRWYGRPGRAGGGQQVRLGVRGERTAGAGRSGPAHRHLPLQHIRSERPAGRSCCEAPRLAGSAARQGSHLGDGGAVAEVGGQCPLDLGAEVVTHGWHCKGGAPAPAGRHGADWWACGS